MPPVLSELRDFYLFLLFFFSLFEVMVLLLKKGKGYRRRTSKHFPIYLGQSHVLAPSQQKLRFTSIRCGPAPGLILPQLPNSSRKPQCPFWARWVVLWITSACHKQKEEVRTLEVLHPLLLPPGGQIGSWAFLWDLS